MKIKERIRFVAAIAPDSIGLFLLGILVEIINRVLILVGLGNTAVSGVIVAFFTTLALLILCFRLVAYFYKKRKRNRID